jgi:AcrR family transcriptional regulator
MVQNILCYNEINMIIAMNYCYEFSVNEYNVKEYRQVITLDGYKRRTQLKKDVILQVAIEMFFSDGISNTSVSNIAQKAKVSKVTIFKYFENKENLAREALRSYFELYTEKMMKIFGSEELFLKKLEMLFALTKENVTMMGKGLLSDEVWKDPLMQQIYGELTAQSMPYMINFIEQGKAEGIVDPAIPTDAILAFISMWASLSNPGTHEVSIEYTLGVSKLFYFGIFGDRNNFDDRMELYKSYERSITGQDSN